MKRYWCYIVSNKSRKLYVGFTNDLAGRMIEHREKLYPASFTARYVYDTLVWYEEYARAVSAKLREKEIKGWRREKKLKLILAENPEWADLSLEWQENPDGSCFLKQDPGSSAKKRGNSRPCSREAAAEQVPQPHNRAWENDAT